MTDMTQDEALRLVDAGAVRVLRKTADNIHNCGQEFLRHSLTDAADIIEALSRPAPAPGCAEEYGRRNGWAITS